MIGSFRFLAGRMQACSASKIISLNAQTLSACVQTSKQCILSGGVIAVPTDTVYGVATSLSAAERLYEVKGRTKTKPLALCVGDIDEIKSWAHTTVPDTLLDDLLPGPVTLVFERSRSLLSHFNPNTNLVGIRIPAHEFIRELCRQCKHPLALTSANVSDTLSTLSVDEFETLWQKIDLIVDGGRLADNELSRQGSTVVDLSKIGKYRIIRPGCALKETVKILTSSKYNLREAT